MRDQAITLLRDLTQAAGVPGSEGPVRRIVARELGRRLTTDATGSIIGTKRGTRSAPRIMLAGHLDEVGFVVQQITPDGFIRFMALGSWWEHTLPSQRVRVLTAAGRTIEGMIAGTPVHFLPPEDRAKLLPIEKLFIDVGARDRADVEHNFGIRLGDPIVPVGEFTPLHQPDRFLAKAFDDRVGVALVIQALQELATRKHPNTVLGVGTAQEEVGARGATTAVSVVAPDVAIVLEGTPADDTPGLAPADAQARLGGGVQVRLLDPSAILNRPLTDFVLAVAAAEKIPHQVAVRRTGGTDAGAIHRYAAGVPTAVLGVPARYIHTHHGIIDLNDYLAALRLLLAVLQRLDAAAVRRCTAWPR